MTTAQMPKFGVVARMPTVEVIQSVAIEAERVGLDFVGMGDSQALQGDLYVHLAMAALVTERIRLASCVTNIRTRHPAVTVNAMATVDRVSAGRAVLGLSIGDSAVFNAGLKPARLAELEEAIGAMRTMMAGQDARIGDAVSRVGDVDRMLPVYLAAEGPRALTLAGKVADGAFVGAGLSEELIARAEQSVSDGAASAGRSRDDVEVWHCARAVVADSREAGLKRLRPALASIGHHGLSSRLDEKLVPAEVQPLLHQLRDRYQTSQHIVPGDSPNAMLVEELGLVDFLADRFAIVGPPEECADRIVELVHHGVHNVLLTIVDEDPAAVVGAFGDEVIPLVEKKLSD